MLANGGGAAGWRKFNNPRPVRFVCSNSILKNLSGRRVQSKRLWRVDRIILGYAALARGKSLGIIFGR